MPVPGGDSEAMINNDQPSVARALIDFLDDSVRSSANLVTIVRSNIQPGVESALTAERVKPFAKVPGNLADHWPERRHNPQAAQLRGRQQAHSRARHGHGSR